jgi:hypothetical protein
MSLKRRRFLVLLGSVGGFSLSACVAAATRNEASAPIAAAPSPPSSPVPSAPPSPQSTLLAQAGVTDPPRGDVRIAVISDLNSQYGSTDYEPEVDKIISLLPGWNPDLVLCGGDMVAGQQPSLTESEIHAMWDGFDRHIAAPLRQAKLPFGFTIGNHDASGALSAGGRFLFGKERDLARAYWTTPQHDPGLNFVDKAGFPFYYSFQQDDIFFLVWDASAAEIPAEQLAWAERSLASPEAQAAKLRLVIGHLPLYAVAIGRDEPGEYLEKADELRSLMERYKVHTYISGHDHAYYPAHAGQLQLLNCGLLGSGIRPLLSGNLLPEKTMTIIDVNLNAADTVYTTYNASTLELFNQQKLPRIIASPNGKILRRDVEWNELTAEEKSATYVPHS